MKPTRTSTEHREVLRDGMRVLVRPLRPEDSALYPDFLAHVSGEDLRLRFFAPLREVSPQQIERLVHYDPARAIALIALDEDNGRLLGVVRLHDDAGGNGAEFAILVRSNLKAHGLGWLLMQQMIGHARAKGVKHVHGQVLAENAVMLKMCGELGFHIADDPGEHGVKLAVLDLAG
jgi:acetyltransferase